MTDQPLLVTRDTPANMVLGLMLADRVRYPCLCAMAYQLAEQLETSDPAIAADCLAQVNEILGCQADPASVRRFTARQGRGWSPEARAFHAALLYLVNEDEARRDQYLSKTIAGRHHFVRCRLWGAREMHVEQDMAM